MMLKFIHFYFNVLYSKISLSGTLSPAHDNLPRRDGWPYSDGPASNGDQEHIFPRTSQMSYSFDRSR
jgi:hypothetical protein